MTPEPADLLRAWQDAIGQLRAAADPITGQMEGAQKLLEQLLQRQAQFEKEVVGLVGAPVTGMLELIDQSAAAMRAQARAFDGASSSFKHASELLDLQASLLERAGESMRDPVSALKSAGSAVKPRSAPPARARTRRSGGSSPR